MARKQGKNARLHRQLKAVQFQSDAFEVAGRRLLSLGGKSPTESGLAWASWGMEKFLAAQRAGWEASWALWSSALRPWSPQAAERLTQAWLRPIEHKVRSNRAQLRSGR